MNFHQFYDRVNGKMYQNGTQPVQYNMLDYQDITKNKINQENSTSAELSPLSDDDMKSTAADDAVNWYQKYGKNNKKLGKPLNDQEWKKYTGFTW